MTSALLADLPVRLVIALGRTVKQAFGEFLARLAELAPLEGSAFELAAGIGLSRLFAAGGGWAQNLAKTKTNGPTPDTLRHRLRHALSRREYEASLQR